METQHCKHHNTDHPIEEFRFDKRRGKHFASCKAAEREKRQIREGAKPKAPSGQKYCTFCKALHSVEAFGSNSGRLRSRCKDAEKAAQRGISIEQVRLEAKRKAAMKEAKELKARLKTIKRLAESDTPLDDVPAEVRNEVEEARMKIAEQRLSDLRGSAKRSKGYRERNSEYQLQRRIKQWIKEYHELAAEAIFHEQNPTATREHAWIISRARNRLPAILRLLEEKLGPEEAEKALADGQGVFHAKAAALDAERAVRERRLGGQLMRHQAELRRWKGHSAAMGVPLAEACYRELELRYKYRDGVMVAGATVYPPGPDVRFEPEEHPWYVFVAAEWQEERQKTLEWARGLGEREQPFESWEPETPTERARAREKWGENAN